MSCLVFTFYTQGKLYRIYDSRMMVQQIASMVETDRTDRARPRGDRIFTNEGVLVNFQEMRGGKLQAFYPLSRISLLFPVLTIDSITRNNDSKR